MLLHSGYSRSRGLSLQPDFRAWRWSMMASYWLAGKAETWVTPVLAFAARVGNTWRWQITVPTHRRRFRWDAPEQMVMIGLGVATVTLTHVATASAGTEPGWNASAAGLPSLISPEVLPASVLSLPILATLWPPQTACP